MPVVAISLLGRSIRGPHWVLLAVLAAGCADPEPVGWEERIAPKGDRFVDSELARKFEGCWNLTWVELGRSEHCGNNCEFPLRIELRTEPSTMLSRRTIARRLEQLSSEAEGYNYATHFAGVAWASFVDQSDPVVGRWRRSQRRRRSDSDKQDPQEHGILVEILERGVFLKLTLQDNRPRGSGSVGSDTTSSWGSIVGEKCRKAPE